MAESPQSNSHTVAPSRSRGGATTIGLAVLLGVLLGGGGLWLYRSLTQPADQSEQIQLAMQNLARSQQSLKQIQSEFEGLRGQLVLEESTRKGLEKSLLATQTELAASEERYRMLAERSQDIVYRMRLLPDQALEYGFVDHVVTNASSVTGGGGTTAS